MMQQADRIIRMKEAKIEWLEAPGRTCGRCSLCCLVYPVPEMDKLKDVWCKHCRPGQGGCSIYNTRPPVCRDYTCSWLDGTLPDHWYPLRTMMVLDKSPGLLRVIAHPDHPDRWREEPFYNELKALARTGLTGTTDETFFVTIVYVSSSTFYVILPHIDVHFVDDMFIDVLAVGRETFFQQQLTLSREEKFERRLSEAVMITRHLKHRRNPDDYDPDQDDDEAFYQAWFDAVSDDIETDRLMREIER
jgi:uncharacterized protein